MDNLKGLWVTDAFSTLDNAVWKLDLLARLKNHGLVSNDAEVEFLDSVEGERLVAFANELYELGTRSN